jgi:OmpR family response regulator RpaB
VPTLNKNILIVDPETKIRTVLVTRLVNLSYNVFSSTNGIDAINILNKEDINLVLIDILLPKQDGYEVCRKIREITTVPIIILTALNTISSRIKGLELGADDYITKPFSLKEVELRINSLLRRFNFQNFKQKVPHQEVFYLGDLIIDLTKKQVLKNNKQLTLTKIEFSLLELLIQNAGRKLSRESILDNIWGYTPERYIDTRVVDVHVHRLRIKLEENPRNPIFLLTIRGIGYMFQSLNR